jgi:hypothetical protein
VEHCIAQDRLKAAFMAVRMFDLDDDFPNVERAYREKTVSRLLGKRLWAVASNIVGNDEGLKKMVLKQVGNLGCKLPVD